MGHVSCLCLCHRFSLFDVFVLSAKQTVPTEGQGLVSACKCVFVCAKVTLRMEYNSFLNF